MWTKGQFLLIAELELTNIEEMMEIHNHHQTNVTVTLFTGKN